MESDSEAEREPQDQRSKAPSDDFAYRSVLEELDEYQDGPALEEDHDINQEGSSEADGPTSKKRKRTDTAIAKTLRKVKPPFISSLLTSNLIFRFHAII